MEPQDKNSQPAPLPPGSYPPPYFYAQPGMQDDEIDLLALAKTIWNQKRLIAAITFVTTTVAIIAALVMTPVFRSTVLLSPVTIDASKSSLGALASQFGGLASLAGVTLPGGGNVDMAIATIKSRKFLLSFVEKNNLKPVLFDERWDRASKQWIVEDASFVARIKEVILPAKPPVESMENLAPGEPTANETYKFLMEEVISVEKDAITSLVTLGVTWKDPAKAAAWANQLIAQVNDQLREQAVTEAERSISYLTEQLNHVAVADLRSVLFRMIEEHTKNMTLAKTQQEYAFKVIDPAVPPDLEDKIKPKRGLMVILGFVVGIFIGVLVAFIRAGLTKQFTVRNAPGAVE